MMLDWTDFPDAPQSGAKLCDAVDVPDAGVLSVLIDDFPVLVMFAGSAVRAFVNACPHQFLPLDLRAGEILSVDGQHLLCSNHTAMFRASDGLGVAGEGLGCALSAIPVEIRGAGIFIQG
ncbi:MAG TPA: hypothetical protein DD416_05110 [Rhodobacteraceae bacterium]|jgi:nitrite reductase/ring-hydroxylating ferredoxin subunit|nr:Rieske 2Fe-2S domain-containing protein [Pseudomonadota bacterium]MDA1287588.1 Rieske 2Fe-2S domain-containing protein [Pseudomonadota bacterium]NQW14432.1 Rieske 2Fe-2S domain-containing protein [Rhodobacter sp.]HBN30601.1 hypothetical protein [Paracoccaceae bacterium]